MYYLLCSKQQCSSLHEAISKAVQIVEETKNTYIVDTETIYQDTNDSYIDVIRTFKTIRVKINEVDIKHGSLGGTLKLVLKK